MKVNIKYDKGLYLGLLMTMEFKSKPPAKWLIFFPLTQSVTIWPGYSAGRLCWAGI